MKIRILVDTFVPGLPEFLAEGQYDVDDTVGLTLIERGQAEAIFIKTNKKEKNESAHNS